MEKPKKIKGILFDFDGVLAETGQDNFNAWKAAMKDFGIVLKGDEYYPLEGMPLKKIAAEYCEKFRIDESMAEQIVGKKEDYYLKNRHFRLYPYVEELVGLLKSKRIKICLVTAALSSRLGNTVPREFLAKFDAVISGEKTKRGKPFPDPYLEGLAGLNLENTECIAVENAPLGIESAKAAGLYCIAICSTLDKPYLSKADKVIAEFKDLKKELDF